MGPSYGVYVPCTPAPLCYRRQHTAGGTPRTGERAPWRTIVAATSRWGGDPSLIDGGPCTLYTTDVALSCICRIWCRPRSICSPAPHEPPLRPDRLFAYGKHVGLDRPTVSCVYMTPSHHSPSSYVVPFPAWYF